MESWVVVALIVGVVAVVALLAGGNFRGEGDGPGWGSFRFEVRGRTRPKPDLQGQALNEDATSRAGSVIAEGTTGAANRRVAAHEDVIARAGPQDPPKE